MPESSRAIARRIALSRRLWTTYHSRGRPGGSGRFSTGSYGRSSWTGLLDVDWVGSGFSAAAGTGILLSRSGHRRTPRRHPRTLLLFYRQALTKAAGHKALGAAGTPAEEEVSRGGVRPVDPRRASTPL